MTDQTQPGVLIEQLGAADAVTALRAAVALSKLGPAVMDPLLEAVRSENAAIRAGAVRTMGWLQDTRTIEPLMSLMCYDTSEDVRLLAQWALVNIGEPIIEPLIRALPNTMDCMWIFAAEALARIGSPSVEPLIRVLADERPQMRMVAAAVLGQIADLRAVEALIAALEDEDEGVRQEATSALSDMAARIEDAALRGRVAQSLVDVLSASDPGAHAAIRQLAPWLKT